MSTTPPLLTRGSSPTSLPTIPEIAVNGITKVSPKSPAQVTDSYRQRYAAYLAATFGISLSAAEADVNAVLTPRKRSDVSEEEVDLIRGRSIL
ncbi:hypothetical protein CAC42_4825 [Sphaceloma murrayae]|uniref:Uncharacterized protein n=1 Tax=Sphaceloma murrayae TaxID=2082308 RepID=A0A2K1QPC6_9PEZI|nr:hypothetical protein CAC42_4825 [Sphaceloma murrayae]